MSDEERALPVHAIIESGKTLKMGDETWVIRDENASVVYFDLLTEMRWHNGIVFLSLAQTIVDAGNQLEANVCVRLRTSFATAQVLHGILGDMLKEALKPIDQSKAN